MCQFFYSKYWKNSDTLRFFFFFHWIPSFCHTFLFLRKISTPFYLFTTLWSPPWTFIEIRWFFSIYVWRNLVSKLLESLVSAPVFKNVEERSVTKSYLPFSLLSVVCQVFKKSVDNRLVDHLEKSCLLWFQVFLFNCRSSDSCIWQNC